MKLRMRTPATFEQGFAAIRAEQDVPTEFPEEVLAEAEDAHVGDEPRRDATDLGFVAVDPPGASDLDQAFFAERLGQGFRVFYAIADLGTFITPGGAIDREARERGTTLYSPDMRTPLHPPILSEDRASLLAGTTKPALLWTIDLDAAGLPIDSNFERATVRVRESITYTEAQSRIEDGDELMGLLKEIGLLREAQEIKRGGISLRLPDQQVVLTDDSYSVIYDATLPVEGWNAQISLLTGIVAGTKMYEAEVGILRTLPPSQEQDLHKLKNQAIALGVDWPDGVDYPTMVRSLTGDTPASCAFLYQAARSFRGAGYAGFNGTVPEQPEHGAIASVYAHVTAPLRRLVDRFGNEILLALYADEKPPAWAIEALDELPSQMGRARSKDSSLERAMVDYVEAVLLEPSIGETFRGVVVDIDDRGERATIQISDPAVVVRVNDSSLELAHPVTLRLDSVSTTKRELEFTVV